MAGLSANIAQELTCPICGEIAINPVRFKVVNEQKQGVCNDIFCEQCVIINFYHIQGTPQSKQPKCPVCNQKIFTDGAMSVSDYYISDKMAKKIVHKILNSEPQSDGYPCKYMCGFIGKSVVDIEAHYNGPKTDCNKKITKCDTKHCFHLDIVGKSMFDHKKVCPYRYVKCPFCFTYILAKECALINHFQNYHKMKSITNIVTLLKVHVR